MPRFYVMMILSIFIASNVIGQTNKSPKVSQVTSSYNSNQGERIAVTKQQMKANPDYIKGYDYVGNHEFTKAINPLKKAIEIDPTGNCASGDNGRAHSELGYAYSRLGDFANAMIYLNKAIEINKMLPEPYLTKAAFLLQKGDNENALIELNELIKVIPDYSMAYVQRGFLYASTNKNELALQDFNEYLSLVKKQKEEQDQKDLISDVKKRIKELEKKIKK